MEAAPISRAVWLAQLQHIRYKNLKGMSSADLAAMLEVGQRTIQRDIQAL